VIFSLLKPILKGNATFSRPWPFNWRACEPKP
jgi:hypothetical protein